MSRESLEPMIKVLIVDDSATIREFLNQMLSADEDFKIVGEGTDGDEAVRLVPEIRPDVVIMDICMHKMDGFEATRLIMEENPVPIVIFSTLLAPGQMENTFKALNAGAVAALEKPKGPGHPDFERMSAKLLQTVKLMSEIKVVRRSRKHGTRPSAQRDEPGKKSKPDSTKIDLVAIGASTGGPPVLRQIIANLPREFKPPVVVVQHIAPGFLEGLVEWLRTETSRPIRIPENGERIRENCVYFAPDDSHLEVLSTTRLALRDGPPIHGVRPSVSRLFESVARHHGARATGVLLTGMGKDGAQALKEMKEKGAVTIAQDKESSVVHGMPGEAIKIGAAEMVCSPEEVSDFLSTLV